MAATQMAVLQVKLYLQQIVPTIPDRMSAAQCNGESMRVKAHPNSCREILIVLPMKLSFLL